MVLIVVAISELITICWLYGTKRLCRDIEFMLTRKTGWYWRICWTVIGPCIMILVLIYQLSTFQMLKYNDQVYPVSYQGNIFFNGLIFGKQDIYINVCHIHFIVVGWFLTAIGLFQIPLWMGIHIYRQSGKSFTEVILQFKIFIYIQILYCF